MDKKYKNRLLALVLSLTLIITYMPTYMFAYATDDAAAIQDEQTDFNDASEETEPLTEVDPEAQTTDGQSVQGGSTDPANEGSQEVVEQTPSSGNADYAENDGVNAFVVQGDAARSESAAADALAEETELDSKKAKALAKSLFRGPKPDDAESRMLDGSEIEWINASWVTEDSTPYPDGYTDTAENLYVRPDSDEPQHVTLQISYSLAGEHDYSPGTIRITVPSVMFKDRDGNDYGSTIIPYPKAPSKVKDFNWELIDGNYVFTNTRTLDAATKGYIEFAFDELVPHELVDMAKSQPFDAYIEITTHKLNRIGLRSRELTAQFDTDVEVNNVQKKANGSPYVVSASSVPAGCRMDDQYPNEQYYVAVDWYVWGNTTSNTMYTLKRVDEKTDSYKGKVHEGYVYSSYDGVDSATSTVTSASMYKDGETPYYSYRTYYPVSQFQVGTHTFKNKITFTAIEDDEVNGEHKTTSAVYNATATWVYRKPTWKEPTGHFNVHKNGNDGADGDYRMRHTEYYPGSTFTDGHVNKRFNHPNGFYGIYSSGLNEIMSDGSAEITYTINTIGYIFPWTYQEIVPGSGDIPATRIQENYNNKSVTMETTEDGVTLNRRSDDDGIELTLGEDYEFVSVEFLKDVWVYKAVPKNINPDGSWEATSWGDGTFQYSREYDKSKFPDIELQIQRNGSDTWETWAVANWNTGEFMISERHDGKDASESIVDLPEGTTCFRTIVTGGDKNKNSEIAAISYDVRPVVRLLDSDRMKAWITEAFTQTETPEFFIYNNVKMRVKDNDGNYFKFSSDDASNQDAIYKDGYDSVRGYTSDTKIYPSKKGVQELSDIDPINQVYKIHYSVEVEEQSFISDKQTYLDATAAGAPLKEVKGIWYDLLPRGVRYVDGSAKLRDPEEGQDEADSIKRVTQIPDYKGTGRTLLIIEAKRLVPQPVKKEFEGSDTGYFEDVPKLTFDAEYPFDAVVDYGDELHNVVAFESGNKSIGTIENYSGEPDDPLGGCNIASPEAFSTDPEEYQREITGMTDLDPDSDGNRFVYAGDTTILKKVSAATTGLSKLVSVNDDNKWTTGVYETEEEAAEFERIVYEGGTYSYRLRMESSVGTETKDIILYDSLENFYAGDGNSPLDVNAPRWQGTFVSVDTSQLEEKGCAPVVYYSTIPNLKLEDPSDPSQGHPINMDLENGTMTVDGQEVKIWTKASEYTGTLSDVKAVAIDASKTKDNKSFVLNEKESIVAIIKMHAPSGDAAREYIAQKAHAYNNIHMLATTVDKDTGVVNSDSYVRKDYTKVGLDEFRLYVTKEWDDDDNRDGIRPESLEFKLLANDADTGKTVTLPKVDEETGELIWTGTFENIPYTDDNGIAISYEIVEEDVDDYTESISFNKNETIFTNRHIPARTKLEGEKIWEDNGEDTRPSRIRVELYGDGEYITFKSVTTDGSEEGHWYYTFDNLYKYDQGEEIVYTVKEIITQTEGRSYISEVQGNNIINRYHPYGDLIVEKYLENATEAASEKEFTFTFTFFRYVTEDGVTTKVPVFETYSYDVLDADGNVIEGLSGEVTNNGTISILGGQKIHIKEIDEYVNYKVTEARAQGFTTKSSNTESQIKPNETVTASFTNKYSASGSAELGAFKVLENRELTRNMFKYEVYLVGESESSSTGFNENAIDVVYTDDSETAVAYSNANISFGAITYDTSDEGKTYTYRIVEVDTEKPGITYDTTAYYATVSVKDENGNGKLTCTVKYYDKDPSDPTAVEIPEPRQVLFKNKYRANGAAQIKAWKSIRGNARPLGDKEFTFELLDENGNSLTLNEEGKAVLLTDPDTQEPITGKNDETGLVMFPELKYDQSDAGKTHHYIAREVIPPEDERDPDVIYTTDTFDYYVKVEDKGDGTLDTAVTFKQNGNDVPEPKFQNEIEDGGLKISKYIAEGSQAYDPTQEFHFIVQLTGENVPGKVTYNVVEAEEKPSGTSDGPSDGNNDSDAPDAEEQDSAAADEEESESASARFSLRNILSFFKPSEVFAEDDVQPFHATDDQLQGTAYAVLTDGTIEGQESGQLIFFRSEETYANKTTQTVTDIRGNTYHGVVFTGVEDSHSSGAAAPQWSGASNEYKEQVISVKVAEGQAVMFRSLGHAFEFPNMVSFDATGMDTSECRFMYCTFSGASSIETLDLRGFDTGKVEDFEYAFGGCHSLTTLKQNFDTSSGTDFSSMFSNCTSITELNLSNFDTSSSTDFSMMFNNCSSLKSVNIYGFDTRNARNVSAIFQQCGALEEVWLGPNFSFFGTGQSNPAVLPSPAPINVSRWIRDDNAFGPFSVNELRDNYTSEMAGRWIPATKVKIIFEAPDADFGQMDPMIIESEKTEVAQDDGSVKDRYDVPAFKLDKNQFLKVGYRFKHWNMYLFNAGQMGGSWGTSSDERVFNRGQLTPGYTFKFIAVFEPLGGEVNVSNGQFEVVLHGNETAVINGLPAGISYNVYEVTPAGWSLVGSGNTSGEIEPNTSPNAWFENEYNPNKTSISLEGVKLFEGEAAGEGTFTFALKEGDTVIETVEVAAGGAIKFSPIVYTETGEHSYSIVEIVPDEPDPTINYSTAVERVDVSVTEENGALKATANYISGKIEFKNTKKPGLLRIRKYTTGSSGSTETFKFRLRLLDKNGDPYTKNVTLSTSSSGCSLDSRTPDSNGYLTGKLRANGFLTISNLPEGTQYVVEEYNLPAGWTLYGTENVEGTIASAVTQTAALTNKYDAKGKAHIEVHKELVGGDLAAGAFTFELLDEDDNVLQTKTNTEIDTSARTPVRDEYGDPVVEYDGPDDEYGTAVYEDNPWQGYAAAIFDDIEYGLDDVGTHYYYIREVVPEDAVNAMGVTYANATETEKQNGGFIKDGLTYDSRLIEVVVEVSDGGEGRLKTKVSFKSGSSTVKELFSNKLTGSLKLKKLVETGSPAKPDQTFTFRVNLKDENGAAITGTFETLKSDGSKGKIMFRRGTALLQLEADETITINGLPIGAAYTVTEDPVGGLTTDGGIWNGWTVVSKEGDTGTISEELSEATITNTYAAAASIELEAYKDLKNKALTDGEYTFGLYDDKGNLITSASNDADGVITFPAIDYTLEDNGKTFVYKVSEMSGEKAGITYDSNTYEVQVTVTDNGDGTMTATKTYVDGDEIEFVNKYSARGNTALEGTKTIVNRAFKDSDIWTFKLEPVGGEKNGRKVAKKDVPMPRDENGNRKDIDTVVLDKDSGMTAGETMASFEFGRIYFTFDDTEGTYNYKITEEAGSINGITYDTKVYNVTIKVSDKGDGTLKITKTYSVSVKLNNNGQSGLGRLISAIEERIDGGLIPGGDHGGEIRPGLDDLILITNSADFSNVYNAEGTATVGATKLINKWGNTEEFSFCIYPESAVDDKGNAIAVTDMPVPAEDVITVTKETPEKFFAPMTFKKAGTYNYVIAELIPDDAVNADGVAYADATDAQIQAGGFSKNGVTYDSSEHQVSIVMEDKDGAGVLTVKEITYDGQKISSAKITNIYNAEGKTDLPIRKKLTGREFKSGDSWKFTLTGEVKGDKSETSAVPMPDVTEVTITPDAADPESVKAAFGPIKYRLADAGKTFVYTITETGDVAGVTNAEPIEIEVEVTDNGNGTLKIVKTPDTSDAYLFENVYSAKGEESIKVEKELTGRDFLDGDGWTFTLTGDGPMPKKADGTEVRSVVIEPAAGDADSAKADFGTMTYSLDDVGKTYTYKLTESGDVAGVTNAEPIDFTVEVIKDNGDGTLEIKKTPDDASFKFTNTYDAKGSTDLSIRKVLKGRKFKEGDSWTFILTGNGPMPDANSVTITPDPDVPDSAAATFGKISFGLEDAGKTYEYTITESGEVENVKNAKPVKITVTVKDNGDGTLKVTKDPDGAEYVFTNEYTSPPPPPGTGDSNMVKLWTVTGLLSAMLLMILTAIKRRKNRTAEGAGSTDAK